ncbi:glycosyltransferase [Micromonospora sp. LAH09]|uniref:glycosyltransferase n=1 Tax=Micromonospora cabrerizensis TaxID=2911213 RepID=UPI001EE984EA|nr:glycosyltransferase [Micromonospora cabrerizensis]MCG5471509.1 glycosyltransferase [Micromonospora cabrerizensis]
MRIAQVSDSHLDNPEGVATSVATTVALLRAAGHRVVLHCPGPLFRRRRRPGETPSLSVPTRPYRLALPRPPGAPVDVVHVHTTGPLGVAGLRWAAARGVPTVLTWHTDLVAYAAHYPEIPIGAAYAGLRLGLRWRVRDLWALARPGRGRQTRLVALGRCLLAHTSVLITPSAKTATMMAAMGGRTPIVVLPTPTAAPLADADDRRRLRARLGIAADAPVLLAVGRATPEKNPGLLLAAFAQVRRELPAAQLVLLGARRHRLAVRRTARRYGVADALHLLRPVPRDRVGAHYRTADVLAFTSTTDTQGLVLCEAEAYGLPVAMVDTQLVERPGTGTTRPVAEPTAAAFGALLTRLLTERELRAGVIRDGRAAVAAWSGERYLAELVKLYATLPPVSAAEATTAGPFGGSCSSRRRW